MYDDTISISQGSGVFIALGDFGNRWTAPTPETLIAKLDAEGIARSRLRLDRWEDGPHDHALSPQDAAEFAAILGEDPSSSDSVTNLEGFYSTPKAM